MSLNPPNLDGAKALLRNLIETRTFRKERLLDEDVLTAIELLAYAAAGDEDATRFETLAILGKAGEISKPIANTVKPLLVEALSEPLPPVGDWGNAEDRFYLAKAVSVSDAGWIAEYAAKSLAQSEISEKLSRDLWAELTVTRAKDLSVALHTVSRALSEWLDQRTASRELAYRKLIRLCEALTQTLLIADVPSGQNFGQAFSGLVRLAGGGHGVEVRRIREEAASSVLDFVVQILRLRFDALLDSDMYRTVGTVRGWWRPGQPPDKVEQRTDRIAQMAMRGLHILARQGVRDNELRTALTRSLGTARVNSVGTAIASSDTSLEPEVSKWLATGEELRSVRSSDTIKEFNEQATDELLGRLILAASSDDVSPEAMTAIADALDLFEPNQATLVKKAAGRMIVIRQWVDALAAKRRLHLYATRGEITQFDPLLHDTAETIQRQRNVRVSVPGVSIAREGRPQEIVIKAVVERV